MPISSACEIARWVVGIVCAQRGIVRETSHAAEEQGVAVGIGGGGDLASQHAARSAAVVHDDLLTEDRRHAGVVFSTSAVTLYSLTDGKVVAKDVKGISSPEKAFVDGKRLYYTELTGRGAMQTPNALKALDMESGKVVWERALKPRSTVPLPP